MDPANPLTASVQVLFGALASFVTGLVESPGDIVRELVSAGRAMRQPQEHFDRHTACRAALSSPDQLSLENSIESEEIQSENEGGQLQFENGEQGNRDIGEEESTQEDSADEDNENHINDIVGVRSGERKRNLQLEKAKTMSSSMTPSEPPKFTVLHEAAFHGSKMSKKILKVIIWLPTDLSLSMARGFHNAPKLYHDTTVNDVPQVLSLRSGLRVAGKELRDGFHFGITGLGTHPRYGLKHEGAKGLLKGVGKAMGGVFLKPTAGTLNVELFPLSYCSQAS
ncbi:hypothetical protein PENSOL_c009G08611 [Penicillium solitum]|uniref:Uncharacterized protein n=1 Tax=Penicillium solitum TaxID=60172 RepID=A0A1V6RA31_9EURO|nr:uncharacterized protein PENSOL_c009G08611 [Penicillium solitum]OQD98395.1 hypothetical protein PENSOL_c009G08611 [Penicillium solitum]